MATINKQSKKGANIKWGLTIICTLLVLTLGSVAVTNPNSTKNILNNMRDFALFDLGSIFLWYTFGSTIFLLYLAISKYGKIRLGGNIAPTFSKFKLFAMALSAGMVASTMYWAFIESAHYIDEEIAKD